MEPLAIVVLAIALDAVIGDPPALYRRIPHPIVLIGRVIAWLEKRLHRETAGPGAQVLAGTALVAGAIALFAALGDLVRHVLAEVLLGGLLEALVASTLLAARSLYDHVRAVLDGIRLGLDQGREAVSHIVGRDPTTLDEAGVVRAGIESAAENFSDGFLAPVFWYVVLGLPGLVIYKTVNTLDSMVGHRTPRYLWFGRVAARVDDVFNWIPARLTGAAVCVAALAIRGADARGAWQALWRDARRHRSMNAGWCEAAFAGALGLALAGPRQYADEVVDDAWMGNGRKDAGPADLERALHLYRATWLVSALGVVLIAVLA